VDGHVGTMIFAVDDGAGYKSKWNGKNGNEEQWPVCVGGIAVVGWAGPSHLAAIPASAEELVEVCCCLSFLNLLDFV
jgi:hypothetical protein